MLEKSCFKFPSLSLRDKILHKSDDFDIKILYTFLKQVSNFFEKFFSWENKLFMKLRVTIDEINCSPVNSLMKSSI